MLERVGFLPRFFASIIDALIYIGLMVFLLWILGTTQGAELAELFKKDSKNINLIVASSLILISTLPLIIDIATEIFLAGSPGKLILGLRIARSDGQPATLFRLFVRCMLKKPPLGAILIASPFLLLGFGLRGIEPNISNALIATSGIFIGISCALLTAVSIGDLLIFSSSKMTLHDIIANTAVFSKEDLEYQDLPSAPSAPSQTPLSTFNPNQAKNNRAMNELIFKKRDD